VAVAQGNNAQAAIEYVVNEFQLADDSRLYFASWVTILMLLATAL
jgi:hypothetical protein